MHSDTDELVRRCGLRNISLRESSVQFSDPENAPQMRLVPGILSLPAGLQIPLMHIETAPPDYIFSSSYIHIYDRISSRTKYFTSSIKRWNWLVFRDTVACMYPEYLATAAVGSTQ